MNKTDCEHKNRFPVTTPEKRDDRVITREICKDCECLIISTNGKITTVLSRRPDAPPLIMDK